MHTGYETFLYTYNMLSKFDPSVYTFVAIVSDPATYEQVKNMPRMIVIPNLTPRGKYDGGIYNIINSFSFVHHNLEYDYLALWGYDCFYCSEKKNMDICNELAKQNKDFTSMAAQIYNNDVYCPTVPNYAQMPYSQWLPMYPMGGCEFYTRNFIENHFDLNVHTDKLYLAGEPYISVVMNIKNDLNTREKILKFAEEHCLVLEYDINKRYDPSFVYRMTDWLPDQFVRYGQIHYGNDRDVPTAKLFIEQHMPFLKESEKYPTFPE